MFKQIKAILELPKEISHLIDCINNTAEETTVCVRSNGVVLDKLGKRPINSGKGPG